MNPLDVTKVVDALKDRFAGKDLQIKPLREFEDKSKEQICVTIKAADLIEVMTFLKEDDRCLFDFLSDVTCVDYLDYPGATSRYGVTYNMVSTTRGHRMWAKCFTDDPEPEVPSVTSLWQGAEWPEREVYDLFGVRFSGHGDLRRLLTWEGFEAHPLRKDYPLHGRGERTAFKRIERDSA